MYNPYSCWKKGIYYTNPNILGRNIDIAGKYVTSNKATNIIAKYGNMYLITLWTTHCLKSIGFLLHRPCNLLSPQALIWAVPALYISLCYLSQSFYQYIFTVLISLSCSAPHFGYPACSLKNFWYAAAKCFCNLNSLFAIRIYPVFICF